LYYTGAILWSASDPTTGQPLPGVTFRQDKTSPDPNFPNVIRGQILVPVEVTGSVQIWATREKTIPAAPPDRGSRNIYFYPYTQNPDDLSDLMSDMLVGSEWQAPLGADSNAPLCEFTVTLNAGGRPIEGAEVQWRVSPNVAALTVMDAATGGSAVPPVPSASSVYWYSVLTDATGTASIYVQAPQTNTIQLNATTLGTEINPAQGQTWYVDLFDPSVDIEGNPLGIPGIAGGYYNLPPRARSVPLQLPVIQSDYDLSSSQAWLWIQTTTGKKAMPITWGDVADEIQPGDVVLPAAAHFTLNVNNANTAALFVQQLCGLVYRSPYTPFGITGNYENKPDPNITRRDLTMPWPFPVPFPGESTGYMTQSQSLDPNGNHLKIMFNGDIPSQYKTSVYELYYMFYLNNGGTGPYQRQDLRYYPDWSAGKHGLKVGPNIALTDYNTGEIKGEIAQGFGPVNGVYGQFYCEYFVVPTAERQNEEARIYSATYAFTGVNWYMNT
jgi:hypothetical protein